MKVINVITQKGGTGKSETVRNLAYGFAEAGKRTLVIDVDPQANSTTNLLKTSKSLDIKIMEEIRDNFDIHMRELNLLNKETTGLEGIDIIHKYTTKYSSQLDTSAALLYPETIKDIIQKTDYENLDIIPASSSLIETDLKLKSSCFGADNRLSTALDLVKDDYDVTIIDHSPFINALTINGIMAAKNEGDLVIIPVKLESASLDGMDTVFQQMMEILKYKALGFDFKLLFTMRNNNKLEKELELTLRHIFPGRCFDTPIRYQAKPITEASLNKRVLIEKSRSNVANDYRLLVKECMKLLD